MKSHFYKQATKDSDMLIVNTVISKAKEHDCVAIVTEDVDILVLMTGLGHPYQFVF